MNARRQEELIKIQQAYPKQSALVTGDIYEEETRDRVMEAIGDGPLHGAFINAGGPPAMGFLESKMSDWDEAYRTVFRWKADLIKRILPLMQDEGYGRIVCLESVSVKQPVPSLVLSNSLRMAIVGMVKTLSDELSGSGITINILGPGYHQTPAVDRVFRKQAEKSGKSVEEVRDALVKSIPAQRMGDPDELASLAIWLLSPLSGYITGQTISVDGGRVRGVFG